MKPEVWSALGYYSYPAFACLVQTSVGKLCVVTRRTHMEKLKGMVAAGVALIFAGWLLRVAGICPVVKRMWTPSWTLWSGGILILMLAAFYAPMELKGWTKCAFPLMIVGTNSIAAYLMAHAMEDFVMGTLNTNLGANFFGFLGAGMLPVLRGSAILLVYWLILLWMHRKRIFIRI